ncbi:MAG TPA: hypothetical protein VNI83_05190, partial [Vicinamibacterales bacterium]|nr:hypothetical protein [Vicinamibacterales bacterium]
ERFAWRESGDGWVADPAPVVAALVRLAAAGAPPARIAGAFHHAAADLIVEGARRARRRFGVRAVALTGGVFQNERLVALAVEGLAREGFDVLLHRAVPCNDGGLALGQAWAAGRLGAAPHGARIDMTEPAVAGVEGR